MTEERRGRNTSPESPTAFCLLETDSGGRRQLTEKGGGSGEFISPDLSS